MVTLEGWHFMEPPDAEGRFWTRKIYDNRQEIKVGETISVEGPLKLCRNGLHASDTPLWALANCPPGPWVARVLVSVDQGENFDFSVGKFCGRHRKPLWVVDASPALHEITLSLAEKLLRYGLVAPSHCLWASVQAKRDWLRGKITDEELSQVRQAAVHQRAISYSFYVEEPIPLTLAAEVASQRALDLAMFAARLVTEGSNLHSMWESELSYELSQRLLALAPLGES